MAPGSLHLVAGSNTDLPEDWLPCAGQVLSKQDYPMLFEAVGDAYSHGSVAAGQFALPDFRGVFALELQAGALPWVVRLLGWRQVGHGNLVLDPTLAAKVAGSEMMKATEMMWVVKAR
jgi:microcystin-dependent protein